MSAIITAAAIVVAAFALVTAQWLYLIYVGAVLFAVYEWSPSWHQIRLRTSPRRKRLPAAQNDRALRSARRWRVALAVAAAPATFVMGHAYVGVITTGTGFLWASIVTVISVALVLSALVAQKQVEELSR